MTTTTVLDVEADLSPQPEAPPGREPGTQPGPAAPATPAPAAEFAPAPTASSAQPVAAAGEPVDAPLGWPTRPSSTPTSAETAALGWPPRDVLSDAAWLGATPETPADAVVTARATGAVPRETPAERLDVTPTVELPGAPAGRHRAPDSPIAPAGGDHEPEPGPSAPQAEPGPPAEPKVSRGAARVQTASELAAMPAPIPAATDTPLAAATDAALRARGTRRETFGRPAKTRLIVVANQKGGVGKTTSAVNLAAALALYGARVLLIDLDPQGNASTALGVEHHASVTSMYDVLVGQTALNHVVRPAAGIDGLWCAPATIDLSGAEVELVTVVARENRLRRALEAYLASPQLQGDDRYDYVFIDCPPSLGLITVNALAAGAEVLIPIQCEYYALEGFSQLLTIVDLVRTQLNPGLDVSSVLLTMYDARTRLASQVADEVRAHFGDTVLATVIPRSVRVSEAPSYSQTVMTYDPGSTGALSYLQAARELATRGVQVAASTEDGWAPAAPSSADRRTGPADEERS